MNTVHFKEEMLKVYQAAENKTASFANQGQGMDGYTELASYRQVIKRYIEDRINGDH